MKAVHRPMLVRSDRILPYSGSGLMKSASIDFGASRFQTHDVAFCRLPEQTSECDDRGHAGAVEEQDGGETLQTEGVSDVAPVERRQHSHLIKELIDPRKEIRSVFGLVCHIVENLHRQRLEALRCRGRSPVELRGRRLFCRVLWVVVFGRGNHHRGDALRAEARALGGAAGGGRGILRGGEERGAWDVPSVGGGGGGGRGQEVVEQDGDPGLPSLGEVGDRGDGPWLVERETGRGQALS
ncbi:hypothetical protein EYF80_029815 [Liparis tanakae]|uniref:Uncharacterized protein n=1 Tax=Liparis tanakae TaxID=230148 RepID=A0A4Z2H4F4_9TELE|nr:hypothetical protein EYF80_029815 [Liparis tanakae]